MPSFKEPFSLLPASLWVILIYQMSCPFNIHQQLRTASTNSLMGTAKIYTGTSYGAGICGTEAGGIYSWIRQLVVNSPRESSENVTGGGSCLQVTEGKIYVTFDTLQKNKYIRQIVHIIDINLVSRTFRYFSFSSIQPTVKPLILKHVPEIW